MRWSKTVRGPAKSWTPMADWSIHRAGPCFNVPMAGSSTKKEFCGLDENLDGTGDCQDDEGNPIGENHKMFHGINEERIELDWDNAASSKEQWYYAAAIVVSPVADAAV
jgi:hypothetical protein